MPNQRGRYRGIYSVMVEDQDFLALSSRARHVLLTLRLGPLANAACLMRVYTSVLAEQTGYRLAQVEGALKELQTRQWIIWERPVVWIRNGLRFDPYLRLADPKHEKAINDIIRTIGPLPIVAKFCEYYGIVWPFEGPSKGSSKGHGRPIEDDALHPQDPSKGHRRPSEGDAPHPRSGRKTRESDPSKTLRRPFEDDAMRPASRVLEREEEKDPVVTREVDSSRTRVATGRPDDLTITRPGSERIAAQLPTRIGDVLAQIGFRP
jgi:hypothetical protein